MTSDLNDLYQETIVDHSKRPRNKGALAHATHRAEGYNPLCGDRVTVELNVEDGRISGLGFEGSGCAISKAAASMMTQAVKGKSKEDAEQLFTSFHEMVTSDSDEGNVAERLGNLKVFSGVREFPVRVKCATLPWHTMHAALNNEALVSTE